MQFLAPDSDGDDDKEDVLGALPFELGAHPVAKSLVARRLRERIDEDCATFAEQARAASKLWLKHLGRAEIARFVTEAEAKTGAPSARSLESLTNAAELIEHAVAELRALQEADRAFVELALLRAREMMEHVPDDPADAALWRFRLMRQAGRRAPLDAVFALRALLSTDGEGDLRGVNPYAEDPAALLELLVAMQLHANRITHASRAVEAAGALLATLARVRQGSADAATLGSVLGHQVAAFVAQLTTRRYTMEGTDAEAGAAAAKGGAVTYDPRYLTFEFLFDIVLRARQVEMVSSFRKRADSGQSSCQQMLMGAGKTTVVGPLLALCLADGERLVTQVMPTSLLEFTRSVMRATYASIVPKKIFTLEFHRDCRDSAADATRLFAKLDTVRRQRGIVCAAPECVKSLMLKFVEQLHVLESEQWAGLAPPDSSSSMSGRALREHRDRLAELEERSSMADALVPVMRMWRHGVLIMDEVDVLLHPLKSELNFPIGHRDKIDLFGYRWELPIFILDAIVSEKDELARQGRDEDGGGGGLGGEEHFGEEWRAESGEERGKAGAVAAGGEDESKGADDAAHASAAASSPSPPPSAPPPLRRMPSTGAHSRTKQSAQWAAAQRKAGHNGSAVIAEIQRALARGKEARRMQTVPHMVLLDDEFYREHIRPAVAKWVLLWLHQNFEEEAGLCVGAAAIEAAEAGRARALVSKQLYRLEGGAADALKAARGAASGAAPEAGVGEGGSEEGVRAAEAQLAHAQEQLRAAELEAPRAVLQAADVAGAAGEEARAQAAGNFLLLAYLAGHRTLAKSELFDQVVEDEDRAEDVSAAMFLAEERRGKRVQELKGDVFLAHYEALCARGVPESDALPQADASAQAEAEEKVRVEEAEARARAATEHVVKPRLTAHDTKLLNLAAEWVNCYLPHVISKIDRVTFGLLEAHYITRETPTSRKLMAVPFVGKDVPSRSSEFAHPDVLIGLSVLAYRYEGLRLSDMRALVKQLKKEYSRDVGNAADRKASRRFDRWKQLGHIAHRKRYLQKLEKSDTPDDVLPLNLFSPEDDKQVEKLRALVGKLPEVAHYYLRQQIFPETMAFQSTKISACGHELGSNILFSTRIGFSGTPSNLLPVDLGTCLYEPGSDGKVVNYLCSPRIVQSHELAAGWSATRLLRTIASHDPPFHALIDTGALVTGMDNLEVAEFLLEFLPQWFEGVVYLDRSDAQTILLRKTGRSMPLRQYGGDPKHRFTFFDQIHTTGMDIKQAPNARAVVTVGKDMTFRDYAQGAFRMRGIGAGQKITLFIIPEVARRIVQELSEFDRGEGEGEGEGGGGGGEVQEGAQAQAQAQARLFFQHADGAPRWEMNVSAWLLLNSMRMESLQFLQLQSQELLNVFRKKAVHALMREAEASAAGSSRALLSGTSHFDGRGPSPEVRMRRFVGQEDGADSSRLRDSIKEFREPLSYEVASRVELGKRFREVIDDMVRARAGRPVFALDGEDEARVALVRHNAAQIFAAQRDERLDQEQEQEQQQEQEEQAQEEEEEEEMKMSQYNRDEEEANPWAAALLAHGPALDLDPAAAFKDLVLGDDPFYPLRIFRLRDTTQPLPGLPANVLVSSNFFRPRWSGLGPRRLKNVGFVLEWVACTRQAGAEAEAGAEPAAGAVAEAKGGEAAGAGGADGNDKAAQRFVALLTLAEGETVRRIIHSNQYATTADNIHSETHRLPP
eukprot:g5839.t1